MQIANVINKVLIFCLLQLDGKASKDLATVCVSRSPGNRVRTIPSGTSSLLSARKNEQKVRVAKTALSKLL